MRILFAHVVHSPGVGEGYREIAAAAGEGLEVKPFCITLHPPGPNLEWADLDRLWKARDAALMAMYERLAEAATCCDVLLNYNGVNIHPEFLPQLPTFNVYCCFDDPEASPALSAPVAAAFDAAFYGNIASRFQYQHWGCRRLAWLPIFNAPGDVPAREEGERVLSRERDVPVTFVGRRTDWRRGRIEMLAGAFPEARCHGSGWEAGKIDGAGLDNLYRRARIGWNLHNSTGPINRRLFVLAGYGVMQICDNKTGLGQIFSLGGEAAGFDTIPEAIEVTRYYLEHEEERREIALAGYHRFWAEYHAGAIWQRIARQLEAWGAAPRAAGPVVPQARERVSVARTAYGWARGLAWGARHRAYTRFGASVPLRRVVRAAKVGVRLPTVMATEARQGVRRALAQTDVAAQLQLARYDERFYLGEAVPAYQENAAAPTPEPGAAGPRLGALSWAATALIGPAGHILALGPGADGFAALAAVDPSRRVSCLGQSDQRLCEWLDPAVGERITYLAGPPDSAGACYDLVAALDALHRVPDLSGFLASCARQAPRALFGAPNRMARPGGGHAGHPAGPGQAREFAPGELYWILRQHYRHVCLYHLPDPVVPWVEPASFATAGTPLIASCSGSLAMRGL